MIVGPACREHMVTWTQRVGGVGVWGGQRVHPGRPCFTVPGTDSEGRGGCAHMVHPCPPATPHKCTPSAPPLSVLLTHGALMSLT